MTASNSFILAVTCAIALAACKSPPAEPAGAAAPWTMGAHCKIVGDVALTAQPSAEDLRAAASHGYRTVVNMRPESETGALADERGVASSLGMRYVAIPVAPGEAPWHAADALAAALDAPDRGPTIVHCASGKRATAVWTLSLADRPGLTRDEILAAGDAAGIDGAMRAVVVRRLGERQPLTR